MTTAEVAKYLGLAGRASVCGWLHRHGIHAVSRQPGPSGQNLYLAELVMNSERRVYDRWRDDQGTHIPDGCRIQQVEVHRTYGGARCRLGQRGVVVGRGRGSRVHVRFDGEQQTVSIRPHLVRVVVPETIETPPLNTGRIVEQLERLRDELSAPGDGAEGGDGR
jgi:hypothetical protein